jgi:hypothetical protein
VTGWRRSLIAIAAAGAMAAPGAAQDERLTVPQIGAAPVAGAIEPVMQISSGTRLIDTPARTESRSPVPSPQLTSGEESGGPTPQLTGEGQSTRQPTQLYAGGKTAQPSQPLSRPAEGRAGAGAVMPVAGRDRCDAAAEEEKVAACRHVIETRSAEFTRPDPTVLSPEQRLLVDQRLREAPGTARTAARRLAETGTDSDSEAAQGVASLVLRPAPPREEEPAASQEALATEAAAAALVNAIINAAAGSGGSTTPPN